MLKHRLLLLLLLHALLTACGQPGPLYLPDKVSFTHTSLEK